MSNLPNGKVRGTLVSGTTVARVRASVSCVNSTPNGTISGTISFFSGGQQRPFSFSSESPVVVSTIKSSNVSSVGAAFENVTVQENTFTPMTDCKAYLNATKVSHDTWAGSILVICPDGLNLFITGEFDGSVTVKKQVFCTPLL